MNKTTFQTQEIRSNSFSCKRLFIRQNDVLRYTVAQLDPTIPKMTKNNKNRYYILGIEKLQVKSPRLFYRDSFSVRFTQKGVFVLECLNVPNMFQEIVVEEMVESEDLEMDSLDVFSTEMIDDVCESVDFNFPNDCFEKRDLRSIFGKSNLVQKKGVGYFKEEVQVKLPLIKNSPLKNNLTENEGEKKPEMQKQEISKLLKEKNETNQFSSLLNPKNRGSQFEKDGDPVLESWKIKDTCPDQLFGLFSNLKLRLQVGCPTNKNEENTFASMGELSKYVERVASVRVDVTHWPKGHNVRKLRRAMQKVNSRF